MPISAVAGWTRRNWPTPLVTPRIRIAGTEVPCWAGMAGREHHAMRQTQSPLHDAMQERCLPQQRLRPSSGKTPPVLGPSSSPRTCISQRLMRRHRVPLTIAGSSHLAPIAPTAQQRIRIRFGALGRGCSQDRDDTSCTPRIETWRFSNGSPTDSSMSSCPHLHLDRRSISTLRADEHLNPYLHLCQPLGLHALVADGCTLGRSHVIISLRGQSLLLMKDGKMLGIMTGCRIKASVGLSISFSPIPQRRPKCSRCSSLQRKICVLC